VDESILFSKSDETHENESDDYTSVTLNESVDKDF
jgi:hypothetical protein